MAIGVHNDIVSRYNDLRCRYRGMCVVSVVRGVAGEVAALAHRPDESGALHAPAEFPDSSERVLRARLRDLCINAHERGEYHGNAGMQSLTYACSSALNPVT